MSDKEDMKEIERELCDSRAKIAELSSIVNELANKSREYRKVIEGLIERSNSQEHRIGAAEKSFAHVRKNTHLGLKYVRKETENIFHRLKELEKKEPKDSHLEAIKSLMLEVFGVHYNKEGP